MNMHSLDEHDMQVAQGRARRNAAEMVAHIPQHLVQSEARIAEQLRHHQGNAFSKLALLHRLLDEWAPVMKPYIACRSGCAACCHYNVSLLPVEAEYIERKTKHKRRAELGESWDYHGQPCPFLKDGRCGIYHARPISCRMHVAFTATAYWCDPQRSSDGEFQFMDLTGVREALVDIAQAQGGLAHTDIRQVFNSRP
jgi:uncharacterized protein